MAGTNRRRFVTAINCIDGRAQQPVINWAIFYLQVDYVDLITEPGPDRILSARVEKAYEAIYEKTFYSVRAHYPSAIILAGHHDCLANPVSSEAHITDIRESIFEMKKWNFGIRLIGLLVDEWGYIDLVYDSNQERN